MLDQSVAAAVESESRGEDGIEETAGRVESQDTQRNRDGTVDGTSRVPWPVTRFQGHDATNERNGSLNQCSMQDRHLQPCLTLARVQRLVQGDQMEGPKGAGIPVEEGDSQTEKKAGKSGEKRRECLTSPKVE